MHAARAPSTAPPVLGLTRGESFTKDEWLVEDIICRPLPCRQCPSLPSYDAAVTPQQAAASAGESRPSMLACRAHQRFLSEVMIVLLLLAARRRAPGFWEFLA